MFKATQQETKKKVKAAKNNKNEKILSYNLPWDFIIFIFSR